jgi:hypothetical protein
MKLRYFAFSSDCSCYPVIFLITNTDYELSLNGGHSIFCPHTGCCGTIFVTNQKDYTVTVLTICDSGIVTSIMTRHQMVSVLNMHSSYVYRCDEVCFVINSLALWVSFSWI